MTEQITKPLRPARCPVRLIPSQVDKESITSQPKARDSPLKRLRRDLRTCLQLLPKLPNIFRPLYAPRPTDELYLGKRSILNVVGLVLVSVLEALLLLISCLSILLLPGAISCCLCVLNLRIVGWVCAPFHGPAIFHAELGPNNARNPTTKEERWIFINGVVVTQLAQIFQRPITGIQNRTYGLFGDLLECIIQRTFSYNTYDARVAYDYLKKVLVDPCTQRVVLICHSQGAIVGSLALDMLFADLPAKQMAKLEIYTFGSAAEHISNPLNNAGTGGVIKYIEHYVNKNDPIPQWGVLRSMNDVKDKYAGRVFICENGRGHLFNQHYLSQMFPLGGETASSETCFLNQSVQVDEGITEARHLLVCQETNGLTPNDDSPSSPSGTAARGAIGFLTGMLVREVSRLSQYMAGREPDVDHPHEKRDSKGYPVN
ncbi:hypothetical protein MGYG_07365 [Nannizzia gypsea CBS 118893]|uniref:DUF676 domain-containing protein n=1 Tax=Arthroderma gypseum (strain ATCC MYA-4604 / CBS 118893) TaxID=535722 RepID=E4V2Y3_ARTGP|nr:hypothetical protein MGYG_07365 [Nannizzia gypsea CBS 118893]EFR04357.1 hypothetical protein MGYG_07365 [Nannizzia gypsea CBS 118893]